MKWVELGIKRSLVAPPPNAFEGETRCEEKIKAVRTVLTPSVLYTYPAAADVIHTHTLIDPQTQTQTHTHTHIYYMHYA